MDPISRAESREIPKQECLSRSLALLSEFEEIAACSSLIRPKTIDDLARAVSALRRVTLRDAPNFQYVQDLHQCLEANSQLSQEHEQALLRLGGILLGRHIESLERGLHAAAHELGQEASEYFLRAQKFEQRCKTLREEFVKIARGYAVSQFAPPSNEYLSENLPPPLEQLVERVSSEMFKLGLMSRAFSKDAFDKWLRSVDDIWRKNVFKHCVTVDGDGSEWMFGDTPRYTYKAELDSEDRLMHLVPEFRRHYHLGFLHSASCTLDSLSASAAVLHRLLGKQIVSFLGGGVLLQEIGEAGEFSPHLSLRRARHEGALGFEIAFHLDRPVSQIEQSVGLVDIRFLDEYTPVIVRSQGASFALLRDRAGALRGKPNARSAFLEKFDSIKEPVDQKKMFLQARRVACSQVGVRTATDAAVFAALVVLRELGFKEVCGVADSDQGALLDRRDEECRHIELYDPLFTRLGFRPPMPSESRLWRFNLEHPVMCDGEHDVGCDGFEDYFARVLARDTSSNNSQPWDARSKLSESSKLLRNFSKCLLAGAGLLAASLISQQELQQLLHHPDLLEF
jgi:hypothetical protein